MLIRRGSHTGPLMVLVAFMLLLWGTWSLWVLIDDDHRGLFSPIVVDASSPALTLVKGTGGKTPAGLEIQAPGSRGEVLVLVDLPPYLQASHFDRAVVRISNASAPDLALEWSLTERFSMAGQARVVWQSPESGVVDLDSSSGWQGQPRQLVLRSVGFREPWVLASVELHQERPDFWSLQQRLWQQHMVVTHEWHVRNINWQYPPEHGFNVSVTLFLAVWVMLSMAVLMRLRSSAGQAEDQFSAGWLLVPLMVAWLLLDVRWQVEVFHKARQSIAAFSELDVHQRGQVELDAEFFEFSERLKQTVNRSDVNRLFAVGDPYSSIRLRYRLAAWGVRAVPVAWFGSELVAQLAVDDLVLLDERDGFNVMTISDDAVNEEVQRVVVQSMAGEPLMHGVVLLKHRSFWAIKAVASQE